MSQWRPSLSSIVTQQSPLMVSLLPSPKERSPHLFPSSRAGRLSPLWAGHCDTRALPEELSQQLASVSFEILGKPLRHSNRSTLILCGEPKNSRDENDGHEPGRDVINNSENHIGIHIPGSGSSFMGPKWTGNTHMNTRNCAAPAVTVTSDTE